MKPLFKQRLPLLLILTTLAILGCRLPFNLFNRSSRSVVPIVHQPEGGYSADRVEFVMPETPGKTIPLETGGSLFVPQGALPEGVEIQAFVSEAPPVLREGMRQVGESLVISTDVQPDQPILLRLPIPPGVEDPENLAILHTTTHGLTTFLVTWVDGDHLAAYTSDFSTFSVIEFIGSLLNDHQVKIAGTGDLLTGQTLTLYISPILSTRILDSTWFVNDKATILSQSDQSVTIQAGEEPGVIIIEYLAINLTRGERWYGSTRLSVRQPSPELDSSLRTESFRIGLTTESTVVDEGQLFNAQVSFHGLYQYPITWTYTIDGCQDRVTITSNSQPVTLPSFRCNAQNRVVYTLYITAQDSSGKSTTASQQFRVLQRPLLAKITGDSFILWAEGGVRGVYEAVTNDSFIAPPYTYRWRSSPGGEWSPYEDVTGIAYRAFNFDQPGEHLVEIQVTDVKGNSTKAIMPVMVWGADPLDAHILSWPDPIQVGEDASVLFRAGGGYRMISGQMTGYRIFVDWGDGSPLREENDVGIGAQGYAPFIFPLTHQWQAPGTYTVALIVLDHAGGAAFTFVDVVVGGEVAADGEVTQQAQQDQGSGRWVLQGPPVINHEDYPLSREFSYDGYCYITLNHQVNQTSFIYQFKNQSRLENDQNCAGDTWKITTLFDAPPDVLILGQKYFLTANFYGEVDLKSASPPPLNWVFPFRYQLKTDWVYFGVSTEEYLYENRFGWRIFDPDAVNTMTWTIKVPDYYSGEKFLEIVASSEFYLSPLNVTWTYRYEP